jgi:cysteine dioxygenase
MVTVEELAQGLTEIFERDPEGGPVLEYLREHPVTLESLKPYLHFLETTYTRNLIYRTPLFELLSLCWEPGHKSSIHNHRGQRCWMAIAQGRMLVQNFHVVEQDGGADYCELERTASVVMDAENPCGVDPEEPIHLVANPPSFGSRAVTLHVYSKPYDTCEVYDFAAKKRKDVSMVNTSEFGALI